MCPRPRITGDMDREINTSTGDYTGERISHLGNAVYLRLMTPLGSWWADPLLGSRLHELAREKDVPRVRRLAVQYSEQALRTLITSGRARSVTAQAMMPHNGWCILLITVVDNTGRAQTFTHQVKVS